MQGQARRGYEETSLEGARNVAADCADGWTAPTRRWGRRDAVLRRLSGRFRCPNPFAWDDEGRTGASSFAASRRYCCTSRACRASGICAAGPSAGPLDGVMRRRCPGRRCVIPSAAHHAAAVRAADDEHADLIFLIFAVTIQPVAAASLVTRAHGEPASINTEGVGQANDYRAVIATVNEVEPTRRRPATGLLSAVLVEARLARVTRPSRSQSALLGCADWESRPVGGRRPTTPPGPVPPAAGGRRVHGWEFTCITGQSARHDSLGADIKRQARNRQGGL